MRLSTKNLVAPPRLVVLPLLVVVALAAGCEPVVTFTTDALRNPRSVALACVESGKALPLASCHSAVGDPRLRAFVSAGSQGTIAVGRPHIPEWLDNDKAIPGFTPWIVDGLPQHVTITDADPTHLYATLPVRQQIARIDIFTGKTDAVASLPFSPGAMAIHNGQARIYLADPAGGSLWWLPIDGFGSTSPTQVLVQGHSGLEPIGGSPNSLAHVDLEHIDKDGKAYAANYLFVGHVDHGHVTVLRSTDLKLLKRLPIGAQCADGIDNDGDGVTDRHDSGCDDREDPFEGDPELGALCSDNFDNDGDGKTDSVDISCAATALHDSCRDGVDNDGDGKTDYPDDPGCTGFAGRTEARDNPSCNDGIDNNSDGKTDTDDSKCDSKSDDTELPATQAGVITPCSDGLDNDKDGKTDTDDSDCTSKTDWGETRPACDDGIDNDGDGNTDADDPDCYNRASASEVSVALAPDAILAASHSGRFVAVGHSQRQQLLVIDTSTLTLLVPVPGTTTPFGRPSKLGTKLLPAGVELRYTPLAVAPVQIAGRDAFAVTLQLRGMIAVRLHDAQSKLSIGIVQASDQGTTESFRPLLATGSKVVDMPNSVPDRFASFGSLTKKSYDDPLKPTEHFGLTMTSNTAEHRSEAWRFTYQGQLPGAHRSTGRFVRKDTLVDAHADFCRLGVVPGDLVLVYRGKGAKDCGGIAGEVVRYRIGAVGADELTLAGEGVVDVPVTDANQKDFTNAALKPAPLPDLTCLPRAGVEYEIRASHWLVRGSVSGIASSVARTDTGCQPTTLQVRTDASRLVEPQLAEKDGKEIALPACPIRVDDKANDLADSFMRANYATGKLEAMGAFSNAVFSGLYRPGCTVGSDLSQPPRLLPSIRDMTWTYAVVSGFREQLAKVGVLAVSIAGDAKLPHAYVVDQGSGSMRAVSLNDLGIQATLD